MTPPTKATDNIHRVFRGGSWFYSSATFVRAAFRFFVTPMGRSSFLGFRCAQSGARQPVLKVTP